MIENNLIQYTRDRASEDIVSIIGRYTNLQKKGTRHIGLCPLHEDKHTGSFFVDENKKTFACYACNSHGDIVDFIQKKEGVGFIDAIKMLAEIEHIDLKDGEAIKHIPLEASKKEVTPTGRGSLPMSFVEKSMSHGDSILTEFLKSEFILEDVERVVKDYRVGTFKGDWTLYWYIDKDNIVRNGKGMRYNFNGHRCKEGSYNVDWIPAWYKRHNSNEIDVEADYKQCLFGEHLINLPGNENKIIAVTESEKAAIVGAMYYDQYIWVSCGSLSNATDWMFRALEGRDLLIFPDAGCYDKWKSAFEALQEKIAFKSVNITTFMEMAVKNGKAKNGEDIVDVILRTKERPRHKVNCQEYGKWDSEKECFVFNDGEECPF